MKAIITIITLLTLTALGQTVQPIVPGVGWLWWGDYAYTTNADGVTIMKYTNSCKVLRLPETINSMPVVALDGYAFSRQPEMLHIVVPDSVRFIGQAICENPSLLRLTLGNGVTTIDNGAFYRCTRMKSITIPNSVTWLGEGAFWECTDLKEINLGKGITNIEPTTFAFCWGLEHIRLGDNVVTVGNQAFHMCMRLKEVVIPASVKYLGNGTFIYCLSLERVVFEGDAPEIGSLIFDHAPKVVVYYREGTTGWGPTFSGRPTVMIEGKKGNPK